MSARRAHYKHSQDAWTTDITWLPDSQRHPGKFNKKSKQHIDCDVILLMAPLSNRAHTKFRFRFKWSIKRVQLLNSVRTSRTANMIIAPLKTEVAVHPYNQSEFGPSPLTHFLSAMRS